MRTPYMRDDASPSPGNGRVTKVDTAREAYPPWVAGDGVVRWADPVTQGQAGWKAPQSFTF